MRIFAIIITLIMAVSACAHKAAWKMELETRDTKGYWKSVRQNNKAIYVLVEDGSTYISQARNEVILQASVLDGQGYTDFRFSVGPVVNGKYYPAKWFDSYNDACNYLDGIDQYDRRQEEK